MAGQVMKRLYCFHPLTCRVCRLKGSPCGNHAVGEPGHETCIAHKSEVA